MVESLDAVFHALSSEPRREMLGALADGERTVGDLAAPFDISLAAISKHLKVLEVAGLVERRIEGRTTIGRLRAEPLAGVREWEDERRALLEREKELTRLSDELAQAAPLEKLLA